MKNLERSRAVKPTILWACAVLAGIVSPAAAINVVESVDFPGSSSFFPGAVSVGTLEPNGNTIAGKLAGHCEINDCNRSGAGDTQDSFLVTVPHGYRIQSLTVTTANVAGPAGFSVTASLRCPGMELIPTTFLVINGTTANLVASPIGSGLYSISVFGQQASQAGSYSLDWSLAIQVELDDRLLSDGFECANTLSWSANSGG